METKDLDRLAAIKQISGYAMDSALQGVDIFSFKTYNEYAAHKIKSLPDIMLSFLQYEGGDDAIYYMQLVWMEDYHLAHKKAST
jgi:hypothetical protein